MGMGLVGVSGASPAFLVLDATAQVLEDLYVLVILPELVLSHVDACHQFAIGLGLQVALDITVDKFSDFKAVDSSAIINCSLLGVVPEENHGVLVFLIRDGMQFVDLGGYRGT